MKFTAFLASDLAAEDQTLQEVKALTRKLYKLCMIPRDRERIVRTASDFGRLSLEAIDSIRYMLEGGYLSSCIVNLRWYLEFCHRFFTLNGDEEAFERWCSGGELSPKQIGYFLKSKALLSMKDTYFTWSNAVHTNSNFMNVQEVIATETPVNVKQMLIVRQAFLSLLQTAHKVNTVLTEIISPYLSTDAEEIKREYNVLHDAVIEHMDNQLTKDQETIDRFAK